MYSRYPFPRILQLARRPSVKMCHLIVTSRGVGQSIGSVKITETDRGLNLL